MEERIGYEKALTLVRVKILRLSWERYSGDLYLERKIAVYILRKGYLKRLLTELND